MTIVSLANTNTNLLLDNKTLGGKGRTLLFLAAHDIKIPRGFILTTDEFDKFLSENGLNIFKNDQIEHNITALLRKAQLPASMNEKLEEYLENEELDRCPLVVRSSATIEDSKSTSFAGQFLTVLNVRGIEELRNAIKDVYASSFSKNVFDYSKTFSVSLESLKMAIIVQELVDGEVSGVMFTKDPVSGRSNTIIEAVVGLNEGLVSGHLTPSRFVVKNGHIIDTQIKESDKACTLSDHGTAIKPNKRRIEDVFCADNIKEVAAIGSSLQKMLGSPQDIEWTMKDGDIYILQSRPITTTPSKSSSQKTYTGKSNVILHGYPGASGTISGMVQIIKDANDIAKPGRILVFEYTDTNFVPLMEKAMAIITKEGGMLSHAAIFSREQKIPSVVGVRNALKLLKDNQRVFVDGAAGIVSLEKIRTKTKPKEYDPSTLYCLDTMLPTTINEEKIYYEILPNKLVYYSKNVIDRTALKTHFNRIGFNLKIYRGGEDKFFIRKRWEIYKKDPLIERTHETMRSMNMLDYKALSLFIQRLVELAKQNVNESTVKFDDEYSLLKALLHLRRTAICYLLLDTVLCEGYGIRTLYRSAKNFLEENHLTFSELLANIENLDRLINFNMLSDEDKKLVIALKKYYAVLSEWRQKTYLLFMEFGGYSKQIIPRENDIIKMLNGIHGVDKDIEYWYPVAVEKIEARSR